MLENSGCSSLDMGKGALNKPIVCSQEYTWDEIKRRNTKEESWIVIDGYIYNITKWQKSHPGGAGIMRNWAGTDASVSYLFCLL